MIRMLGLTDDKEIFCICIRTRGGIYGEIWPEPKGVPKGAARGNSRGFRPYFTVYPELSPNTDIISKSDFMAFFQYCAQRCGYNGRDDSPYVPLWEGNISLYTP